MLITIYFCNTFERNVIASPEKNGVLNIVSLAALLHHITMTDDQQMSFCIDGSGINNRDPRDLIAVFTYHLETQVNAIAEMIKKRIAEKNAPVILNLYGLTRGGAAAYLLCQKLLSVPKDKLQINLACIDPLAGNYGFTIKIDSFFNCQNALTNQIRDLSTGHLSKMLALFTPQFTDNPFIGESAHYPIFPSCPTSCSLEIDVTPGISSSSDPHKKIATYFVDHNKKITAANDESILVFQRVVEFLQTCGAKIILDPNFLDDALLNSCKKGDYLIGIYDQISKNYPRTHTRRNIHGDSEIQRKNGTFLNNYHQQLLGIALDPTKNILSIVKKGIELKSSNISANRP